MRELVKFILYMCHAGVYLFSADIIAQMYFPPYIEEGHVSSGFRLPIVAGAAIMIVFAIARILKIEGKAPLVISSIIGIAGIGLMIFGPYSIGSGLNVFLLLWYIASGFLLGIVSLVSLLALLGVITERHLSKWTD